VAVPGHTVRARLNHPVIDADGHWAELFPLLFEYIREVAGPRCLESFRALYSRRVRPWYELTPEQHRRQRLRRPVYWGVPTSSDRLAGLVPSLYRESLDQWGIDVSVLYPTVGLGLLNLQDRDMAAGVIRAYNTMVADLFSRHADRIVPVGVVSLAEPGEAIRQLEHAHALGLRQVVTSGTILRTVEADADWQPDPSRRRVYVDGLGLDSPHDYDPVWAKFVDLKMAVTPHGGSMAWPDRTSPTNFVANHLGHFAQSHHLFARSLVLGGVTQRFPTLNFGFLEGGIGWACGLYSDLIEHWEKRNRDYLDEHLRPVNLDRAALRTLLEREAGLIPRLAGKIDDIIERNLDQLECDISQEELTERDRTSDDFAKVKIKSKSALKRLFTRNFYFGCEADDPMTAIAFNPKMGMNLKPILGSDISHFDVVDATGVLGEAFELVENGLLTEDDFCAFTFRNAAHLFAGMNPDFFAGTSVADEVEKELKRTPAEQGTGGSR
jgi:predicted TIM-barrel fold metal-dependent hydrolase